MGTMTSSDTVQNPDDKGTAEMSPMTTCSKKAQRPQRFNRGGSANMDAMTSSKTAQPERATREGTAGMITMTSSMKARYRPGAKRRGVNVIPHATRLRTQLTWRNLALVAGFCLVIHVCLSAQHAQSSRRRLMKFSKSQVHAKAREVYSKYPDLRKRCRAAKSSSWTVTGFVAVATAVAACFTAMTGFAQVLSCILGGYCPTRRRRLPVMECPLKEIPNPNVRRRLPVMERLLKEIEAAR